MEYTPPTAAEIRAARKELGITQAELAKIIDTSLRMYQHYEDEFSQWQMPRLKWEEIKRRLKDG